MIILKNIIHYIHFIDFYLFGMYNPPSLLLSWERINITETNVIKFKDTFYFSQ